tara:strand:- start:461 stop:1366 length:906 start_codon:yes stop_codon:yes gene_type:complete
MDIEELKNLNSTEGEIHFEYDLKKLNWFNIGGKAKIFFKANTLKGLIEFLKVYKKRGKIFVLGAGSNVLITDGVFNGAVIKLGKSFQNLTILNKNLIIAGCGITQKKLSEFSKKNNLSGMEFLSCIPGSIGGGIRMNSGCFDREFKDILISIQCIDYDGSVKMIDKNNVKFEYRGSDLPKELIFLSATFKGEKEDQNIIQKKMLEMKEKKESAQPTKVKTGGSTFKNPKDQTKKKVWELIKESVPSSIKFGDAAISEKHANFFVNKKEASFDDMKKLISTVKDQVFKKTGVMINTEIIIVE